MAFLKLGRHREGGLGDFISHVRQHYWPPDDFQYIPEEISKRTNFALNCKSKTGRWERHNVRRKENLEHGFFSVPHEPYRPVGEVLLDPCDLVTKTLRENLQSKKDDEFPVFKRQPYIFTPARDAEKTRVPLTVGKRSDTAQREHEMELRAQQHAGMREIKAALDESNRRIVVCNAGQNYLHHVQLCQDTERWCREQKEARGEVAMELQRLSSHMFQPLFHTTTPQPHRKGGAASEKSTKMKQARVAVQKISPRQMEEATAIKEAKFKRLTNRKLQVMVDKLESMYTILVSIYNMKTKHLRQKVPLSMEVVKMLRAESSTDPQHHTDTRAGSIFMKGTRSHAPSNSTFSGLDMLSHADKVGSLLDNHAGSKPKLPIPSREMRRGSVMHRGSITLGKGTNQSLNKSFKRKNRNVIMQGQEGDTLRLETWEDLLNVTVGTQGRTKQPKASRKLPPWQQVMVSDLRTYQQTAPPPKDGDSKTSHDTHNMQGNMIKNWKEDIQEIKKQMRKDVVQDLERIKRERCTKFKYKLVTFLDLPPLFEHHQELLMSASVDAMRDPSFVQEVQEETVPWFDQLEQEIQSLGLMGEPEAVNSMLKLERFKYSEDILHAKFVLSQVFECKVPLLEKWLAHRKLYII